VHPPPTRTCDKTDVFSTRTKNKVEKRISFFIDHEVLFYETTFSALEHSVQITLQHRRRIEPTDREVDHRCLSPLQRKPSELEGEEKYTNIFLTLQARLSEFMSLATK
jgi:hypothetical protein